MLKKRELFHYDSEALVFRKTNRLLKYRIIVVVLFLSVSLLSFVAAKKPEKEEVLNCLIWRQRDAEKNSVAMLAQSL